MNKKTKLKLNETLNKALEPPKKKDLSKLDELLNPYDVPEKPRLEVVNKTGINTAGSTNKTGTTSTARQLTSPEKDFTKTPNSVVRVAQAQGLFRGKSKQIYDFLWSVSRGAVNPTRKVRKTFNEIQKGSGLGSRNTVMSGIIHLESINLIIREVAVGESAGNTYEIFTPEELGYAKISAGSTSSTSTTETTQKLVVPVLPVFGTTGTTQTIETKGIYERPKTSFKDIEESDDEAYAEMLKVLSTSCKKLSGKSPGHDQKENWKQLAELLVMELEIAAARTKSISNVPAFLTEHLRRRLIGNSTKPTFKVNKPLQNGKSYSDKTTDVEIYQAEPLSKEGRETVLKTIKEYLKKGQVEFVMSFRETYTEEDWKWLMEETQNKDFGKI